MKHYTEILMKLSNFFNNFDSYIAYLHLEIKINSTGLQELERTQWRINTMECNSRDIYTLDKTEF